MVDSKEDYKFDLGVKGLRDCRLNMFRMKFSENDNDTVTNVTFLKGLGC